MNLLTRKNEYKLQFIVVARKQKRCSIGWRAVDSYSAYTFIGIVKDHELTHNELTHSYLKI